MLKGVDDVIESLSYLTNKNFNFVFDNYKTIFKLQDYTLLFSILGKIKLFKNK
jgi:hypothetical protein